ncbi:MAG: T9SS type A sorting domain-containing protein [Microscillaceae bacterium]|nr:T9SS type A sorting domain-containing protein [Microscillaceae bacterium]
MKKSLRFLSALILLWLSPKISAQINFVGSAGLLPSEPQNCIQITPESADTVGWVYSLQSMDLTKNQSLEFDLYLGMNNSGGDGLVFVLHNDPRGASAIGCKGQGLGYGINSPAICNGNTPIIPSVGIEIDIFQNSSGISFNDPANDHLAYVVNGDLNHGTTNLNDIQNGFIFTNNIENNVRHAFRFEWTAATKNLRAYWEGNLVLDRTSDIPTILGTNNAVWGFTGATGGFVNQLYFCSDSGVTLSTALPISLFTFTGKSTSKGVLLSWQTLSEENNDFFAIERSSDARSFETIGIVDGAGNSNQLISYESLDDSPFVGANFYRLRQTDFDGKSSYSSLIFVDHQPEGTPSMEIYPNPAVQDNSIKLSLKGLQNQNLKLHIQNIYGQVIYEEELYTLNQQEFSLRPALTPGIYLLSLTNAHQKLTQKLIVQ